MNKKAFQDASRVAVQGKNESHGTDCRDVVKIITRKEHMVSISGRVVEVGKDGVWAETNNLTACHHCSDRHGCGVSALSRVFGQKINRIRVSNSMNAHLGDEVVLGIKQAALLKETMMFYLAPLIGMLIATAASEVLLSNEVFSLLAALCGFAIGLSMVRLHAVRNAEVDAIKPVMLSCKSIDRNIP